MSRDVQDNIDKDHHKLGRHRAKFTTGSISPSVRGWAAMGADEQERRENFKQWAAEDFTKGMDRVQAAEDAYNRVMRGIDSAAPLTPHTAPKPTASGIKH